MKQANTICESLFIGRFVFIDDTVHIGRFYGKKEILY